MSKTLLIIGGSVAGTAVVAGGAATGIVISQQNSSAETSNQVLANIKAKIENDNKLDKKVSASSIYPDGTGTKLNATQLAALGLEETFEGYTVGVTVDTVSETSVTFNVTLNKEGESEQTVKVTLLGFTATDSTAQAIAALVASVNGKVFAVKDTTEYVQALSKELKDKELAAQLALVLAKNDTLNAQKSAFDQYASSLTSQVSITSAGNLLAVTVVLTNDESITFSLDGFANGESALKTKATDVAGDYAVLTQVSAKTFASTATVDNLASLVNGLSEKLTANGVSLVSISAESVLDTATVVVFKVVLGLNSTDLETQATISVTGLKAETEIADEEAQAQLDAVVAKIKGATYSVNDTTTSVNEFIAEASAGTIASLIDSQFKTALGNAEVSAITVSAQSNNSKAVAVVATLKVGSKSETTTFNVDNLVSNSLAEANALLEKAATAVNGKTFNALENTYVSTFVANVDKTNLESKLATEFSTSLAGATINTVNARVSATDTSVATVELVLGFAGTEATKVVSITVSNLTATPTDKEKLAALIEALQGSSYAVKTATSTDSFAETVEVSNVTSLVSGLESKLTGLTLNGVSVGSYNDVSTTIALTLTVTLADSTLSGTAVVTVTGLSSSAEVEKADEVAALEKVVNAIRGQTYAALDSSMTVSQFKATANASTVTSLVNAALQTSLGSNAKITALTVNANENNLNEVNVDATITVGESSQTLVFNVNGLESDQTAAANATLDKVATSLNDSSFNAKVNVEANVFAKTVTTSNIQSLLNDTFTKDLSTASINVLSASVVGTNRDNVQIKLTLGHSNTSVTKEVTIKVTNLSSAPESESAQAALDAIVAKINNTTFATKEAQVNSTFVDEVSSTGSKLTSLLADSFASAITGATVSGVESYVKFDANSATEVTLNVVLSYPQANNRTATITVSNLVTPQTAANQALQKAAQNMADQWSNRSVPVASEFVGLNTNQYQDLLKSNLTTSLPAAILTSFGSAKVSLKSVSFVPVTGDTVSVSLSVVAYTGAPEITVSNLTLTGLVPFGVANGQAYVKNALETAANQALDKWSDVVPVNYDTMEADRFAAKLLVAHGTSGEAKLNALAQILHLTEAQVHAISKMKLSIPSLISTNSITYDFVVEYENNVGTLYLVLNADATGPIWTDGNETDIRYEVSTKVSLSKFITFKDGHYQSLSELVSQANTTKFEISNTRTANEWVNYFKPSWQYQTTPNYDAKVMLLWMANETSNDLLKAIYERTASVEINAFTINNPYSFTLTATIVDTEGTSSKLNITFDSQAPEYTTIYTGLNVIDNYDLTFLFSRNVKTKQKALADIIALHGGSRADFADVVRNFANLKAVGYKAASDDSRDTVIFTLLATDGTTEKIALQFQDLKVAPIKNWIETSVTAQAFELITQAKWIRTQMVVAPSADVQRLTWVQGQDYLIKLFFYRNDSLMDVNAWFNRANGVNKVQLSVLSGDYINNWGNKFSKATFSYEMVGFDGSKIPAFQHDYVVQYYDAYYYGGANWNNPNWDTQIPSSALYNVYADLLVNGISVGWI